MSEAAVAIRLPDTGFGKRIVIGPRQIHTRLARYQIRSWAGDGEYLNGDTTGIHVRESRVTEIGEFVPLDALRPGKRGVSGEAAFGNGGAIDAGDDVRNGEVLFQGNDAHGTVLCQ